MKTTISDLSGLKNNNIICSIKISPNKKWVRKLKDKDGNEINIYKLKVERSLNSGNTYIIQTLTNKRMYCI